jgi:hypothetical protein
MGSRSRHRRRQLDRAGIAERTGVSTATVDYWHLQRAQSGFPVKADTDADGRDWWWKADIDTFYAEHLAARAAKFTRVDRTGSPRDLLTAPQAAQVLGYKNHRSLPNELLHNPDQAEELPSGRPVALLHVGVAQAGDTATPVLVPAHGVGLRRRAASTALHRPSGRHRYGSAPAAPIRRRSAPGRRARSDRASRARRHGRHRSRRAVGAAARRR